MFLDDDSLEESSPEPIKAPGMTKKVSDKLLELVYGK